ncbi:MAG: SMI1/KNR4 family protein [Cellvibrionaceae bacterium]
MNIFNEFADKWIHMKSVEKESDDSIRDVEKSFQVKLPDTFKYFVKEYGSAYCPGLLGAIVEGEYDLYDVQNFENLRKINESTEAYLKGGMPSGFIAFANDCMGNIFCFKTSELNDDPNKSGVWFFDHDVMEMKNVAPNFQLFIAQFNKIGKHG